MTHQRNSQRAMDALLADTLPLRIEDRLWGFTDLFLLQSGLAIATWSFLIGGVTATFVGFWDGIWTMLLGNSIGVIPMLLASALPASKWGTEHYIAQRSIFGPLGVMVPIFTISVIGIGWINILAIMFGESSAKIWCALSGSAKTTGSLVTMAVALLAIVAGGWIVIKGAKAFGRFNRCASPGLIVMSAVLLIAIFSGHSLTHVAAAPALNPRSDHASNIMLALELNINAGMSWWSLAANVSRSAKTQRIALWAGFLGYVPVAVLAQAVGLVAALVLGSSDPTDWILPIFGPVFGLVLLILIGFANITSLTGVAYASIQTMVQHLGRRLQNIGWSSTTSILFGLCAVSVLVTRTLVYDKFLAFAAWSQAVLAPAIGVTLADYYVLRRQRISVADLYAIDTFGRYYYWNRVNYAALFSLVIGAVIYVLAINPATLVTSGIFKFATASVPALCAAFIAHVLLSKLWVIPAGKGGYYDGPVGGVERSKSLTFCVRQGIVNGLGKK